MTARNRPGPDKPPPHGTPTNDPGGPQSPAPGSGGAAPAKLPPLTQRLRDALERHFDAQGDFGPAAGPTEAEVRRLIRNGLAAGLTEKQVSGFLNPAFYRGVNDPAGGGKLLHDLSPEQLRALADYAATQSGSGLDHQGGSTNAQARFFEAFPELQQKYMSLANTYAKPFDPTNAGGTTPPGAVLGSDGRYHNPNEPLPEGVTVPNQPSTTGGATPQEGTFLPFTGMTPPQEGVPGYPLTPFATPAEAMTAAHTAIASHYASAAAAGDFETAGKAFDALAQHQSLLPQQSLTIPDTFSEQDLAHEPQYR